MFSKRLLQGFHPIWKICYILLAVIMVGLITFETWEWYNVDHVSAISYTWSNPVGIEDMKWGVGEDLNLEDWEGGPKRKVVIGAVSCRNKSLNLFSSNITDYHYSEKTLTMFKSVIISAKLHNISSVEIHLFLEHREEDEKLFVDQLAGMGYPNEHGPEILLFIHSAVDTVPEKYWDHMIYHPKYRCGYVRFFFPSALPEVDSIIHLDSDMVITGNLWKIWNHISNFNDDQLIGVARGNEAHDTHHLEMHQRWYGDIPHPPPKGVNAGLLLMNLTRMREYSWEQKFLRVYDDYASRVNLTGQRTVNILLSYDLSVLKVLSCQYNFFSRHCHWGFTCRDAAVGGIHLVHGNGHQFESDKIFHEIYMGYKQFNMTILRNHANDYAGLVTALRKHLMIPIRIAYNGKSCSICWSKCHNTLNHILFEEFFVDSDNFTIDIE